MNNKICKYEFKNQLIIVEDNTIKIETLSGYQSSFELIIDNKELISSIHQWLKENQNVNKFIKIKYINECCLWEFSCENKTYTCFGEDLSLLNLNI